MPSTIQFRVGRAEKRRVNSRVTVVTNGARRMQASRGISRRTMDPDPDRWYF